MRRKPLLETRWNEPFRLESSPTPGVPGLCPDALNIFLSLMGRWASRLEWNFMMGAAQDLIDRSMPTANVRAGRCLPPSVSRRRFLPAIGPHFSQHLLEMAAKVLRRENSRRLQDLQSLSNTDDFETSRQLTNHIVEQQLRRNRLRFPTRSLRNMIADHQRDIVEQQAEHRLEHRGLGVSRRSDDAGRMSARLVETSFPRTIVCRIPRFSLPPLLPPGYSAALRAVGPVSVNADHTYGGAPFCVSPVGIGGRYKAAFLDSGPINVTLSGRSDSTAVLM